MMRSVKFLGGAAMTAMMVSGCAGGGSAALSESQAQAVEDASAKLLAAVQSLKAGLPAVENLELGEGNSSGDCPTVSLVFASGALEFNLDYGAGCTNEVHGTAELSGTLSVVANLAGRAFEVAFDALSLDDQSVDGLINVQFSNDGATGSANTTFDVTTAQHGSAVGSLVLTLGPEAGVLTAFQGMLTLTDATDGQYEVTVDTLVFDPVGNGNLIPEGGSLTFEVPNDGPGPETITILVEYSEQSPTDGVVTVTVGVAEPVSYQLPMP